MSDPDNPPLEHQLTRLDLMLLRMNTTPLLFKASDIPPSSLCNGYVVR